MFFAIYLASKDGYEDSILPFARGGRCYWAGPVRNGTTTLVSECVPGMHLADLLLRQTTPKSRITNDGFRSVGKLTSTGRRIPASTCESRAFVVYSRNQRATLRTESVIDARRKDERRVS